MDKAQEIFAWAEIKAELARRIGQLVATFDSVDGNEMYRLQGEVRGLKKLGNLPQSLLTRREIQHGEPDKA